MVVSGLNSVLEEIKSYVKQSHFQQAYMKCVNGQVNLGKNESPSKLSHIKLDSLSSMKGELKHIQFWELQSLKSYCLINLNRISEANQILQKCIKQRPFHSPSHRRLGYLYQKEGNLEEALQAYKIAELYQPDNQYISQKIIMIQMKIGKSEGLSDEKEVLSGSLFASTDSNSKGHVTFGNSQIFEMISEESDQYFAQIKQELVKLNEIKPKKSILKASKSMNKISTQNDQFAHSENQNNQKQVATSNKVLSIKSCEVHSPIKWDQSQEQVRQEKIKEKIILIKKEKRKRKSVSFTFLEDQIIQKQND